MDGSRIRKEKVAFSNENGYVWTWPQSVLLVGDKQMRFIVQYTEVSVFTCSRNVTVVAISV